MAYRLLRREPVEHALSRIACEELDAALRELDRAPEPTGEGIHQARKHTKRLRALLTLHRGSFARARREARAVRDAARALSGPRDAVALLEAHDAFAATTSACTRDRAFQRVRDLLEDAARSAQRSEHVEERVREAARGLRAVRERVPDWRAEGRGFDRVQDGLGRAAERARRKLRRLGDREDAELLHEWRKRVKEHWYHLRLVEDAWREVLEPLRHEAGTLGKELGAVHDLFELEGRVRAAEVERVDGYLELLVERRRDVLRAALRRGRRLHAEKGAAFARRVAAWWRAR
ncbi:MAG: CHAD domain-containing protein [Planctomycetota bacterium]